MNECEEKVKKIGARLNQYLVVSLVVVTGYSMMWFYRHIMSFMPNEGMGATASAIADFFQWITLIFGAGIAIGLNEVRHRVLNDVLDGQDIVNQDIIHAHFWKILKWAKNHNWKVATAATLIVTTVFHFKFDFEWWGGAAFLGLLTFLVTFFSCPTQIFRKVMTKLQLKWQSDVETLPSQQSLLGIKQTGA